jgi:hypothetical protein
MAPNVLQDPKTSVARPAAAIMIKRMGIPSLGCV